MFIKPSSNPASKLTKPATRPARAAMYAKIVLYSSLVEAPRAIKRFPIPKRGPETTLIPKNVPTNASFVNPIAVDEAIPNEIVQQIIATKIIGRPNLAIAWPVQPSIL